MGRGEAGVFRFRDLGSCVEFGVERAAVQQLDRHWQVRRNLHGGLHVVALVVGAISLVRFNEGRIFVRSCAV